MQREATGVLVDFLENLEGEGYHTFTLGGSIHVTCSIYCFKTSFCLLLYTLIVR